MAYMTYWSACVKCTVCCAVCTCVSILLYMHCMYWSACSQGLYFFPRMLTQWLLQPCLKQIQKNIEEYRKTQKNIEKYRKIQKNKEKTRKIQKNKEKSRKIQKNIENTLKVMSNYTGRFNIPYGMHYAVPCTLYIVHCSGKYY